MKLFHLFPVLMLVCFCSNSVHAKDDYEDEEKKSRFGFVGVNLGSFFANKNTAIIYNGTKESSSFGIQAVLDHTYYKPILDNYFQNSRYYIYEYPIQSKYKTALDLGVHAGINLGSFGSIFMDVNVLSLRYEQAFTMAIDDPLNQSPEPTYAQIPIIGEEERFYINLGTQVTLEESESILWYFAVFATMNDLKLNQNYFVIGEREYPIFHINPADPNQKPGGVGYGFGTGTGVKVSLNETIKLDFTYNLTYSKTKMNESLQPFGLHHALALRIIWG